MNSSSYEYKNQSASRGPQLKDENCDSVTAFKATPNFDFVVLIHLKQHDQYFFREMIVPNVSLQSILCPLS